MTASIILCGAFIVITCLVAEAITRDMDMCEHEWETRWDEHGNRKFCCRLCEKEIQ